MGEVKDQVSIAYSAATINNLGEYVTYDDMQKELDKIIPNETEVTPNSDKTLNVYFLSTGHNYNIANDRVEKTDTVSIENPLLWEYDETTGTIYKYIGGDVDEIETLVIPRQINGTKIKSISRIGYDNLLGNYDLGKNIKNVIVSEGIEVIDEYAFQCMNMVKVKLPSTIKVIKEGAFGWCEELETINFPEGLEKIEGWGSFDECIKLNNITFPSTLTEIGEETFYDCYSLEYVYIPKTLVSVDYSAFQSGCAYIDVDPEHENYKSIDGVFYSKDGKTLLTYCAGNARTEYTVPDGTELIKDYAFDSNKTLVTINIPSSVQTIESAAFYRTYALKTINIDRRENAIEGSKWYAGGMKQSSSAVTVNWIGEN